MKRPSPASSGASAWIDSVQLTEHFCVAYSAEGQIDRNAFGHRVRHASHHNLVAGDEIKVSIEIELVEQKQKQVAGWRPLACPACSSYPN